MEWNDNDLDKLFKDAYQQQSSPKNADKAWQHMLTLMNNSAVKASGIALWKKIALSAAALLLLISTLAVFYTNPFENKEISNTKIPTVETIENNNFQNQQATENSIATSTDESSNASEDKVEKIIAKSSKPQTTKPMGSNENSSAQNTLVQTMHPTLLPLRGKYFDNALFALSFDNSILDIDDYAQSTSNKKGNPLNFYLTGGWHLHNHWKLGQEFSLRNLPSVGFLVQKGISPNVAIVSGARYYFRGNMDYLVTSQAVSTYMFKEYKEYFLRIKSGHWIEIPLNLQIQVSPRWMLESGPVAEILTHHQSELEVHTHMPALDVVVEKNHQSDIANEYRHGLPRITLGWRTGVYGNLSPQLQLGTGFKYVPFVDNLMADKSIQNNAGWDIFLEMRYRLF